MVRAILVYSLLCGALIAQSNAPAQSDQRTKASPAPSATSGIKPAQKATQYRPDRFAGRAGTYYRLIWGIDDLSVKSAEGGEVIRFTYRVIDADKAKLLNDGKIEPSLIDERAQVKLVVPQMDKVGKLRQTTAPQPGKTYWMIFSNKGGYVKHGDHVNVEIGNFHAEGLVVD